MNWKPLAGALAALLTACAACSSAEPTPVPDPNASTSVTDTTTTTDSASDTAVTAETIAACRALAEDQGLAGYWSDVANGTPSAPSAVAAANAIRHLEVYLPQPEVDPTVVDAIQDATDAVAADAALPSRPDEFRAVVTPIVDACQAVDIDMAVE